MMLARKTERWFDVPKRQRRALTLAQGSALGTRRIMWQALKGRPKVTVRGRDVPRCDHYLPMIAIAQPIEPSRSAEDDRRDGGQVVNSEQAISQGFVVGRIPRLCPEPRRSAIRSDGGLGAFEQVESLGQSVAGGLMRGIAWDHAQAFSVVRNDAMLKHGAVNLVQDVLPNVDYEIRVDTEDVAVEGGVVDLTQRKAVANRCSSGLIGIRDDVGGIQEACMAQLAD